MILSFYFCRHIISRLVIYFRDNAINRCSHDCFGRASHRDHRAGSGSRKQSLSIQNTFAPETLGRGGEDGSCRPYYVLWRIYLATGLSRVIIRVLLSRRFKVYAHICTGILTPAATYLRFYISADRDLNDDGGDASYALRWRRYYTYYKSYVPIDRSMSKTFAVACIDR